MLVAFHEGWDFDKIGKELKISDDEVDRLFSDLDTENLASLRSRTTIRGPTFRSFARRTSRRIKAKPAETLAGFARIIAGNWSQIETMAASLNGANGVPKEELMYEIVASGNSAWRHE